MNILLVIQIDKVSSRLHGKQSITNSYKEGKVCILPHTHGAISGGEYHRYSEFAPFGCVPVIEHFADTIGIEVYEQCGGAVFASYEEIWETAIDVVQKIDRGLYIGSSQRYELVERRYTLGKDSPSHIR